MILENVLGNRTRANEEEGSELLTLSSGDGWSLGTSGGSESTAMKISAVNRCVQVVSDSMGKLPIRIFNETTKERLQDHQLNYMLSIRTNEAMPPSDYKKLMEKNVLLKGNAYALIWRHPRTAEPMELIPLPHCWPVFDKKGKLWYIGQNPRTGEYRKFTSADIIHYRYYTEDGIGGVSVLSHAQSVIQNAAASQAYEHQYYSQRARPDGILSVSNSLKSEAKEAIRKEWESFHRGADNAFRIAILDLGLEYQPIGVSPKDSQFIENKEITVKDIARFFGVPLYKLYEGDQSYNSNEQNSIEYVVNTLHPRVQRYDEEDTYKLLFDGDIREALRIKRNMLAELKGDFSARGDWYEVMHRVGAFSPNNILDLEDMPDTPGGDVHFASLNYVPLDRFAELSEIRAKNYKGKVNND